jgi:hypothetical protein
VKYAVENALHGTVFILGLMMTGSGIKVTLRLLPQQFERLQCWYY